MTRSMLAPNRNTQGSLIVHRYSTSDDTKVKPAPLLLLLPNKRRYWLTIGRFHCTVNIQQKIRQNVRLFERSWKRESNEMLFVVVYNLSFNRHALSLSRSFISSAEWRSGVQILWWVFFFQKRKASSNSRWRWSITWPSSSLLSGFRESFEVVLLVRSWTEKRWRAYVWLIHAFESFEACDPRRLKNARSDSFSASYLTYIHSLDLLTIGFIAQSIIYTNDLSLFAYQSLSDLVYIRFDS